MSQQLDIKQLRKVAEVGIGTDVVPVTRNWLRAALKALEPFPVLDVIPPAAATR